MTPEFVCKIRFIENEGSMMDAKAIVVLESTRNTMQEDWERSCGSVNAAVREKLVWKDERIRYQEDVPFPEEQALFQKVSKGEERSRDLPLLRSRSNYIMLAFHYSSISQSTREYPVKNY